MVEDPVHVHDLHATILHLLGIDHTKLTYRFQGRDFRLTDVTATSCPSSWPEHVPPRRYGAFNVIVKWRWGSRSDLLIFVSPGCLITDSPGFNSSSRR